MKNLTITQITEAFPDECREMIPRVNRILKKELKPFTDHCKSIRNRLLDDFTTSFLIQVMRIMYQPDHNEKIIKRNSAILNSLDAPKDGKINDAMIEQAKEVHLVKLYDFQGVKSGNMNARYCACCPFHNEKTGSFFVYPNNTFYCFGCHVGGDSIEFVRKLHGFAFPEAVKFLINQ